MQDKLFLFLLLLLGENNWFAYFFPWRARFELFRVCVWQHIARVIFKFDTFQNAFHLRQEMFYTSKFYREPFSNLLHKWENVRQEIWSVSLLLNKMRWTLWETVHTMLALMLLKRVQAPITHSHSNDDCYSIISMWAFFLPSQLTLSDNKARLSMREKQTDWITQRAVEQ